MALARRRRAGAAALRAGAPRSPAAAAAAASAAARRAPRAGPVTNLPLPRFVSMRAETANARRGPEPRPARRLGVRAPRPAARGRPPSTATGGGCATPTAPAAGCTTRCSRACAPRWSQGDGAGAAARRARPRTAAVRAFAEPGAIGRLEACARRLVRDRRRRRRGLAAARRALGRRRRTRRSSSARLSRSRSDPRLRRGYRQLPRGGRRGEGSSAAGAAAGSPRRRG